MEKTVGQVQEVGSSVIDTSQKILEVVGTALKPAIDVALPIAKQAGEQALKIASPVISEATKKAQEAIQSTGVDTEPVLSAAKVCLYLFQLHFLFLLFFWINSTVVFGLVDLSNAIFK